MNKNSSTHTDLTKGPINWHLFKMATPMAVGILAIMSMYLADTFFLGQIGSAPLAAMGFIFPVINILNGIAFGIGAGASSVIARAIGAQDTHRVQSYTTQAILLALLIALTFAIIGWQTIEPLFSLLGAPNQLTPLIAEYMNVWYLGCFLVVVPMVGNSAIRAAGNSRVPSLIMIAVAVVNIILDPILIFGLFGLPAMGLQGAAIATIAAYSVSFIMAIFILRFKLNMLVWQRCWKNLLQGWTSILKIGVPAVGNNLIAPLSVATATWLVSRYGIEAVAGFNIAARIESFCLIPLMAIASIMGPFMGQNLGAEKIERLQIGTQYSYKFAFGWGIFVALSLMVLAAPLVNLFSEDASVQKAAYQYLYVVPCSYAFLGMIMITASSATGMGSAIPALLLTLLRLLILYLPLAAIGSYQFGLMGIFVAALLANVITGLTAFTWLRQKLLACIKSESSVN